jgi:carbon-monoxide dehydrogenase medium subunit
MSLVPAMKMRLMQPEHIIDISKIRALSHIRREGEGVALGAVTTYRMVERSRLLATMMPLLPEAASQVGDIQVRNRGTVGGAIAHADPAGDLSAALLASDASLYLVGGKRSRSVSARRFFLDPYETVLGPTEIVAEIRIPAVAGRTGSSYVKFGNKASRFAVVGVAASITLDRQARCVRARIAITGAGPKPARAGFAERYLVGKRVTKATLVGTSERAGRGIEFLSDIHGSEDYREHLTGVITLRALRSAVGQVMQI